MQSWYRSHVVDRHGLERISKVGEGESRAGELARSRFGRRAVGGILALGAVVIGCSEAGPGGADRDNSSTLLPGSFEPEPLAPPGAAGDPAVPADPAAPGTPDLGTGAEGPLGPEGPATALPIEPTVPVEPGPPAPMEPTLRSAAERTGRLVGVAFNGRRMNEGELAGREFNYVTGENEMKWNAMRPAQGVFDFTRPDQIMALAEQYAMQVKGHTLVWYRQLPRWVTALTDAETVRSEMLQHIETVVSRYRGRIHAWDVVNEAWDDAGTAMRPLVFRTYLGDGYIDEAFHAARAADPDAKLYYNDFGAEGMSVKANNVYEMVRGMVMRGVPIDGVGLQLHVWSVDAGPSRAELEQNMQRLAELGLEVVLSEIDVSSCGDGDVAQRLETQRQRYYNLSAACVAQPACKAVSVWGISDSFSWLNGMPANAGCTEGQQPLGLMFDADYAKKPAYYGVFDALMGL